MSVFSARSLHPKPDSSAHAINMSTEEGQGLARSALAEACAAPVQIVTNDGVEFDKPVSVIRASQPLQEAVRALGKAKKNRRVAVNHTINSRTFAKIVEFCDYHSRDPPKPCETYRIPRGPRADEICAWDWNYVQAPHDEILALIQAANYLKIDGLLDLCSKAIALLIKGKSPEQIRETFHIANDFTPEEEALLKANPDAVLPRRPRRYYKK